MAVEPALTTRGARGGRRCVMSGSLRRVVFPFSAVLSLSIELELDGVAADAGGGVSGERPRWPRGVLLAVLLLALSTPGLMRQDRSSDADAPLLQMLLLLLRPSSGCSSTSSTR